MKEFRIFTRADLIKLLNLSRRTVSLSALDAFAVCLQAIYFFSGNLTGARASLCGIDAAREPLVGACLRRDAAGSNAVCLTLLPAMLPRELLSG
jgi:hypothetical protein